MKKETRAGYYTRQKCKGCGKLVEIEALNFLLNLDKKVLCKDCQRQKENPDLLKKGER